MSPVEQMAEMRGVMENPDAVREIQDRLLRYQPAIKEFGARFEGGSPIVVNAVREIACYTCDLCAELGVEFDPAIATLLLQVIGGWMGGAPDRWEQYTNQTAPQVNANRLRKLGLTG